MSGYISLLLVKVKRWNIIVPYFHKSIFVGLRQYETKVFISQMKLARMFDYQKRLLQIISRNFIEHLDVAKIS